MKGSSPSKIGTADPRRAARLMRRATYASVSTAVLLVVAKLAAWGATDSVAMLSSLIDSLLAARKVFGL